MTVGDDSSSDGNGGMQDIEERVKFKSPTLSLSSSGTQRYAALLLPLAGSGDIKVERGLLVVLERQMRVTHRRKRLLLCIHGR
jgi:hypothetical protein